MMGSVTEGAEGTTTDMQFTVTYTGSEYPGGFTVFWKTVDDTAEQNSDYQGTSNSLSFSGAMSESKTFVVQVKGDQVAELDEQFFVEITSISQPNIAIPGPTAGAIQNDDSALVHVRHRGEGPIDVPEGDDWMTDSSFEFGIFMEGIVDVPIDVFYKLLPMDPEQQDFSGLPDMFDEKMTTLTSSVILGPGFSYHSVDIQGDTMVEPAESFYINITRVEASGRDVQRGEDLLRGGIVDDDLLVINVGNREQLEGTGGGVTWFNVPVTLGNQVEDGVSITFQTVDYTASIMENDFPTQMPFVEFEQAETAKDVFVQVTQDDKREANEKFTINLTDAWAPWGIVPVKYNDPPVDAPQSLAYVEPFGLITIKNDDEGIYTNTGGGSVAFYRSPDTSIGMAFQNEAQARYSTTFNVGSWADLIASLQAHVAANGRVGEIAIFDHGTSDGQWVGSTVSREMFEQLAPFLNDGAAIWLVGCNVGQNGDYCDWIADDAGPGAIVTAPDAFVWYPGLILYRDFEGTTPGGSWLSFNGYQKP